MKILQVNKFLFLKGGAERYLFDVSELLSKKGHQVVAWSSQHPKNFSYPDEKDFAEFLDLSKRQGFKKDFKKARRIFWNKEAKRKLERIIKLERPDLAHLHNIFSHFSPSIIYLLKKHKVPIALTLHDYKFFCPNYQFFSSDRVCLDCLHRGNYRSCLSKKCIKGSRFESLLGYLEAKWQKDFLKIADKIDVFIAPSMYIRRRAISWGIPSDKVIHLPNFIDDFHGLEIGKSRPPVFGKKAYLLYFGRLSKEKGVDLLIESFLKTKQRLPNLYLKIAGSGPDRKKLEELGKNSHIEFLGIKRGHQLKELISNASLIIIPSIWPENFPYSILESHILSRPVLASKIGGVPEMIKDRETGLLFKPNDQNDLREKIIWARKNSQAIKDMAKQAQKEAIVQYNSEDHYQKLIKIYDRIKNN